MHVLIHLGFILQHDGEVVRFMKMIMVLINMIMHARVPLVELVKMAVLPVGSFSDHLWRLMMVLRMHF